MNPSHRRIRTLCLAVFLVMLMFPAFSALAELRVEGDGFELKDFEARIVRTALENEGVDLNATDVVVEKMGYTRDVGYLWSDNDRVVIRIMVFEEGAMYEGESDAGLDDYSANMDFEKRRMLEEALEQVIDQLRRGRVK